MKAKIKFVRKYDFYGSTIYEAIYESGRVYTYWDGKISKPVREFIESKTPKKQHDRYHGEEFIYM